MTGRFSLRIMGSLLVVWVGLAFRQDTPPPLQLFLLIGQSNMAGRGVPEASDKQAGPRIWTLTKEETWVPAADPLHFDKPAVVGVGPGLSFARTLLGQYPAMNIGLIPAAVGGSGIDVWVPGAYYEPTRSHPYDDAIRRARKALENGQLAGILWHQGESDSKPENTAAYGAKLSALIRRLRQDLKAPGVPVVLGTLGDFYVSRNASARLINQTLQQMPDREKNTYCALASGLTDKGDTTHFDSRSARELGRRYAAVFIDRKLLKQP